MKNLTQKQITEYIEKLRQDRNYHGFLTDASFPKDMSQKRLSQLVRQHQKHGFDDTELWNLDTTLAQFILPRLKRFKRIQHGYPSDFKSAAAWRKKIDSFIWAFEFDQYSGTAKQHEKARAAIIEFGKYFNQLWD